MKNLIKGVSILVKAISVDAARVGQQAARDLIQGPVKDGMEELKKTVETDVAPALKDLVTEIQKVEQEGNKMSPELVEAVESVEQSAKDIKKAFKGIFAPPKKLSTVPTQEQADA